MKLKNLASIAALLLATLTAVQAQTNTLVGWSFDNLALGANGSPAAATNTGMASAVGLTTATVVAQSGSSTGLLVGTNAWKVGGGWSTNNAIGSQGVQFSANSVGYYQVQVSFDIYPQTNAEALLQVQYSPDGNTWFNANITSAGNLGMLATNTSTASGIVVGTYLVLTNTSGVAAWDNGVKVDLSGVSWVDNNPNFAIRIVNAAKGTNCVATTGANYTNNASIGDWTFDNVVIQGVPFDAAAVWTFEGVGTPTNNYPVPSISNTTATAACFGFNVTSSLMGNPPKNVATNAADILANGAPYSSSGPAGQNVFRLRGAPGNGWLSTQPIGTQGAEFDVDTTSYTNILISFDIEFTAQSEAKMCVEYTTDSWATTNVANSLAYALNPAYIMTNTPAFTSPGLNLAGNAVYSPNTVNGTLLFNTFGAIFFNNMIVDLTGLPNVANNPHFAFRIVNAAMGSDCVNGIYGPYNNTSGNCRVDNIAVNGKYTGSIAPTVTAQSSPAVTVDHTFTNTFPVSVDWSSKIYSIIVNGLTLPPSSYAVTSSNIIYTPSLGGAALTTAGTDYITIYATNYTSAKVTQVVGPGVFTQLYFVQPASPSASGGTLTVNPSFTCVDQFTNPTALTYPSMQVIATVSNSPATWVLGGSVTQAIYNGACTFSNLTAAVTGTTAISNAAITFTVTSGPITVTNSTSFIIGAPPVPFTPGNLAVIQSDISGANSTLSIIEVKPSSAGQTSPVNIIPITATGTNALRMVNSGSGGHLALSDDGTKLVFAGYADDNSATPDETFNLNRGVGTLDYTNAYVLQAKYVSSSYGGSQARAACSPDNSHYLIDDKGGLYIADNGNFYYNLYNQNNISTKSFGGVCWVATAKTTPASPTASVFIFSDNINANGVGLDYVSDPRYNPDSVFNVGHTTPAADSFAQDFYMVSTNGNDYSILYVLDAAVTSGVGAITKYKMSGTIDTDFTWVQQGSTLSLADNGNHLFATTNGSGSVYLFFVNGKNQIIRLTDQTVGGPLTIISSNKIYTATSGNIQGITFAPQQTAYATELTPPPILTAQATAPVSGNITITNTPDDGNWRSNITSITVNGVVLPSAAYNTNTTGAIVLIPSASTLLQSSGSKTIVISATGYSTNSVVQTLAAGVPNKLVMKTEPSASVSAGAVFATAPAVYIEDSYGNVVTTATSNIVVTVGSGTGPLTGTRTNAAVAGVATFSALAAPTLAQTGLKLTFTNSALTSAVDTTSITVTAGAPAHLAFGQQPTTTVAGVAVSPSVTVLVQDAYGNTVTSDTSSVSIVSLNTGFAADSTLAVNAVAGVATFSNLKPTTAGSLKTLGTIDVSEVPSYVFSSPFTVGSGSPAQLAITTQPAAPAVNGSALVTQPVVVIEDQYSNVVTTATSNIVAQVGTGAWTIGGTTTKAAVSGVSTFTDLTAGSVSPVSVSATISFASTGLTGVTSAGFNIPAPTPGLLTNINNIIVIYQENWSFDALYGNFPGANGIANASSTALNQLDRLSGNPISSLPNYDPVSSAIPTQNPPVPLNGVQDYRFLSNPGNVNSACVTNTLMPYGLEGLIGFGPTSNTNNLTGDIVHRYWQEQFQIDNGNMDKFVTWSDNPGLVMSHFDVTADQLPEALLAQQYTLCDNFFHSAFGGSFLNHQFLIAAQAPVYPNAVSIVPNNVALLDGNGVLQLNVPGNGRLTRDGNITPIGGVVFANTNLTFDKNYAVNTIYSVNLANGNPTATTFLPSQNDSNPSDPNRPFISTIGDQMDAAGVSWKWYSGGWDRALAISGSNPTNSGVQGVDTSIKNFQWHHQAFAFYDNYAPWTNGVRNARSAAHLQDENNFFADVTNNTLPSVVFIKALGDNNEHPGYASLLQGQQHVASIVAAVQANHALWAHTAIIITYDEHGGRWDHVAPPARDIWGPGSRVPAIIISPYAKTNHVEHTQYDTTAILATIEHRFGVTNLNSLDANSPTLVNVVNNTVSDPATAPTIAANRIGNQLALSWPAVYLTYILQSNNTSLLNPAGWVTVPGVSNNAITIPIDDNQTNVFYRLKQQ